jgi:hypothetical protein
MYFFLEFLVYDISNHLIINSNNYFINSTHYTPFPRLIAKKPEFIPRVLVFFFCLPEPITRVLVIFCLPRYPFGGTKTRVKFVYPSPLPEF